MNQEACARCSAPRAAASPFCTNCGAPFGAAPQTPAGGAPTMVAGGQGTPPGAWTPAGQPPAPGMPPQQGAWGPPAGGPPGPGQPWTPAPPPGGTGGGFNARIAIIVGLVVLLLAGGGIAAAVMLSGDDDDSGNDKDKSSQGALTEEEFCEQWQTFDTLDEDDPADFERAQQMLADIEKRGTPEDMPAEAREGFTIYLEVMGTMDSADDLDGFYNLAPEKGTTMQAFFEYLSTTCPDLGAGDDDPIETPSGAPSLDIDPSEIPSFDPSNLPTIDPSDLPSFDEDSLRELESQLSELASP